MIVCASTSTLMKNTKDALKRKFKMKDLGILRWVLGIEFKCFKGMIGMNQTRYINKLLVRFRMINCKPKVTPSVLEMDKEIDGESPELDDQNLYRQIVGSLIYVLAPGQVYVIL